MGAASAIATWTSQGKWVGYLLVTRGEAGVAGMHAGDTGPLRMQEEVASAAVVGVDTVDFLAHSHRVVEYGLSLCRNIGRAVSSVTVLCRLTWRGQNETGAGASADCLPALRIAISARVTISPLAQGLTMWSTAPRACIMGRL